MFHFLCIVCRWLSVHRKRRPTDGCFTDRLGKEREHTKTSNHSWCLGEHMSCLCMKRRECWCEEKRSEGCSCLQSVVIFSALVHQSGKLLFFTNGGQAQDWIWSHRYWIWCFVIKMCLSSSAVCDIMEWRLSWVALSFNPTGVSLTMPKAHVKSSLTDFPALSHPVRIVRGWNPGKWFCVCVCCKAEQWLRRYSIFSSTLKAFV